MFVGREGLKRWSHVNATLPPNGFPQHRFHIMSSCHLVAVSPNHAPNHIPSFSQLCLSLLHPLLPLYILTSSQLSVLEKPLMFCSFFWGGGLSIFRRFLRSFLLLGFRLPSAPLICYTFPYLSQYFPLLEISLLDIPTAFCIVGFQAWFWSRHLKHSCMKLLGLSRAHIEQGTFA